MRRSSAERALCLRRTEGQQPHGTGRGVAGSSPAVAPHHAVKLSGKSALFCDMPKASNQRCGQGGCGFESRHRFQLSADDAGSPSGPPASPQYEYQVRPFQQEPPLGKQDLDNSEPRLTTRLPWELTCRLLTRSL